MNFKKYLFGASLVSMFALTVPASFADCPIYSDLDMNKVTPDKAMCKMKEKKEDKCNRGCPTGYASPCTCKDKDKVDIEHKMKMQSYAYPNDIYSPANSTLTGIDNNTVVSDDLLGDYNGVMVKDINTCGCGMTGAASSIDDDLELNVDAPKNVVSPTSMEIKNVEIEEIDSFTTGFATPVDDFEQLYPDVPESNWASDEINRLTEQAIVVGYPDEMFKPYKNVTRAEMASMVVKGYNLEGQTLSEEGNFTDVPKTHWAYVDINKGVASQMLEGYNSCLFKPNGNITRAQALTILSKGVNCPMDNCKAEEILSKYSDGSTVPTWAKESVAKAIDNGALKNEMSTSIRPNDEATRAEISSMLQSVRIAGGYDTEEKVVMDDPTETTRTFIETEKVVTIPTLELRMNDIISAKNSNVDEQFSATTLNEITINGTMYPAGSLVRGKVTEVVRPTKNDSGSIKLSFDRIIFENCQTELPKQVHRAVVEKQKELNLAQRMIQFPFTWIGQVIGTAGRAVGGAAIGLANASEALLDQTGVGTTELLSGKFKAAGRSYQDGLKTVFRAPVDLTRTALSGTLGTLQSSADELTYLVNPQGIKISRINPKEKVTIAFGE